MKSKKIIKWLISVILVFVLGYSLYNVYLISMEFVEINRQNEIVQAEYVESDNSDEEDESDELQIKWQQLLETNQDVIGWIYIPDTKISYPVVQGDNNEKYLRHDINGKYAKTGTIFVDCHNLNPFYDFNTVIYGHNLMNNSSMFSELVKYRKQSFADSHQIIYIYLPDNSYLKYKVVSFHKVDALSTDVYNTTVPDKQNFINSMEAGNRIAWDFDDEDISSVITLSTCTNIKENERYILHAVMVQE